MGARERMKLLCQRAVMKGPGADPLERRLARIKKLFEWGDMPESEYLAEKEQIKEELSLFTPKQRRPEVIDEFRGFLADASVAWSKATSEQKNRLARQLFDIIWTKNERVVSVRPRPELRPLFQISEECQAKSLSGDPDRIRTGDLCLDRAVC